ncbi:hypothetical protein BDZ97DRAFT_1917002 [Flammula alnicola]|nr:hypothetical protein BDZ97DRAFT_1917002 [Flammula alnicola]
MKGGRNVPKTSLQLTAAHRPSTPSPSKSKSTGQTPKLKAIVLLTPRKVSSPQKRTPFPQSNHQDRKDSPKIERIEYQTTTPSKVSKGKQKAEEPMNSSTKPQKLTTKRLSRPSDKRTARQPNHSHTTQDEESDDPITISSPSKPSRSYSSNREDDNGSFLSDGPSWPKASSSRNVYEFQAEGSSVIHDHQSESPIPPSPPTSRKRKRVPSDVRREPSPSRNELPDRPPTSRLPAEDKIGPPTPKKGSSRRRRMRPDSDSDSERGAESSASDTSDRYRHKRSHSRANTQPPVPYAYPHPQPHYSASHHLPHTYTPIPDPRAQLIITQAMQQLSALVGAPWTSPHQYIDGTMPHTPSHRHQSSRPSNASYTTPTHHHHPYPYTYDPNLSHATLPPDSPDFESAPENPSPPRRKSLVRRSRSRGRRVSFKVEVNETRDERNIHSSPSDTHPSRNGSRRGRADSPRVEERPKPSKGKGRVDTRESESDSDQDAKLDANGRGRSSHIRGQTPGPNFDSSDRGRPSSNNQRESRGKYRDA